jgi:hypothetical protein
LAPVSALVGGSQSGDFFSFGPFGTHRYSSTRFRRVVQVNEAHPIDDSLTRIIYVCRLNNLRQNAALSRFADLHSWGVEI